MHKSKFYPSRMNLHSASLTLPVLGHTRRGPGDTSINGPFYCTDLCRNPTTATTQYFTIDSSLVIITFDLDLAWVSFSRSSAQNLVHYA